MISFLRRHQKSIFYAVLAVFLSGIFVGLGGYWFTSRDMDGVVARVGENKITQTRFAARVNQYAEMLRERGTELSDENLARLRREVANDMVVEEILADQALKLGLTVTDDELARDIQATPAFQQNGRFEQEIYFAQVRRLFRESPQEYEAHRRRAILAARAKQLVFRMAKVAPKEVEEAYRLEKKGSMKGFEKDKAAYTARLQQQRALDLINHWLRQVGPTADPQIFQERVDGV
jgi:peptidyl-prolyl cis-trans isomerase D